MTNTLNNGKKLHVLNYNRHTCMCWKKNFENIIAET